MVEGIDNNAVLDEEKQSKFRGAVGMIGWVAQVTRPELSFHATSMATKYGKATVGDAKKVMRTLNKINKDEGYLT